jgi:hypothetical protein
MHSERRIADRDDYDGDTRLFRVSGCFCVEIPWPKHWPERVTTDFLRGEGFEIRQRGQ